MRRAGAARGAAVQAGKGAVRGAGAEMHTQAGKGAGRGYGCNEAAGMGRDPRQPGAGSALRASRARRRARGGAMALACFALASALIAAPAPAQNSALPAGEIVYRTERVPLAQALQEIALVLGLELRAAELPAAFVAGRFREPGGQALLDRLAAAHDFDWFLDEGVLAVSGPSLRAARRLSFADAPAKAAFLARARALAGPGYGLALGAEGDGEAELALAGPAPWLAELEALHAAMAAPNGGAPAGGQESEADEGEFGVMVFHLRHAWAEDKTLRLGGTSTTLPGIASLIASVSGIAPASGGGSAAGGAGTGGTGGGGLAPQPAAGQGARAEPAGGGGGAAGGLVIRPEPRLNAVLVRDRLSRRAYYEALIRELDQPVRMVHLEAFIFDVSRARLNELGVRWQAADNDSAVSFQAEEGGTRPLLSIGTDGLRSSVSDRNGVLLRLQAIEEDGDGDVLSRPSVLTLNNHEAVFNSSQRFYVRVASNQDAQLFPVTVTTELRVTPRIVEDDGGGESIHMLISVTDGSIDNSSAAQVDDLPQVSESFISTQGLVADGESLLIGGQITSRSRTTEGGVPILKEIPLFGLPFSYSSETSNELVRIFMLTPRIETLGSASERLQELGEQVPALGEELSGG